MSMTSTINSFLPHQDSRTVLIAGAGASVEYGLPGVAEMSDLVDSEIRNDHVMQELGCVKTYNLVKCQLENYLHGPVNYEQIYHCVHELLNFKCPDNKAADEFKPLMYPFVNSIIHVERDKLRLLERKIITIVYNAISSACESVTSEQLEPLRAFLQYFMQKSTLRIYTTNHDDLLFRASDKPYTGFDHSLARSGFQSEHFWDNLDRHSLFYLHGSVHMGYDRSLQSIGELTWFADLSEARKHADFWGSGNRQMDGTQITKAPIVTGLNKLPRIQQSPFSYYYSCLAQDIMKADLIVVIGSGLGDLHLNTWLKEARARENLPPLLFVDYWKDGMMEQIFELDPKSIEMFHSLRIDTNNIMEDEYNAANGWTVTRDQTAAVWDKGFHEFMKNSEGLDDILGSLPAKEGISSSIHN